jgi:23S rRNA (adenine2030-N6)-methyltransferase
VVKHLVLVHLLEALRDAAPAWRWVDTHAASGFHRLKPGGEWTRGAGALLGLQPMPSALQPLLHHPLVAHRFRQADGTLTHWPGSPLWMSASTRPSDRLLLVESEPEVLAVLERRFASRADAPWQGEVTVRGGDGCAVAAEWLRGTGDAPAWVHVDPPYADRSEWDTVVSGVGALREASPAAEVVVWYPWKGRTRPPALCRALARRVKGPVVSWDLWWEDPATEANRMLGAGLVGAGAQVAACTPRLLEALGALASEWPGRARWQVSSTRWA